MGRTLVSGVVAGVVATCLWIAVAIATAPNPKTADTGHGNRTDSLLPQAESHGECRDYVSMTKEGGAIIRVGTTMSCGNEHTGMSISWDLFGPVNASGGKSYDTQGRSISSARSVGCKSGQYTFKSTGKAGKYWTPHAGFQWRHIETNSVHKTFSC